MQLVQVELTVEACRQQELRPEAISLIETNIAMVGGFLEALGITASPGFVRLVYAALDGLALQQLVYGNPTATDDAIEVLIGRLEAIRGGEAATHDDR